MFESACLPVILSAAKDLCIFLVYWTDRLLPARREFFAEFSRSEMKRILRLRSG